MDSFLIFKDLELTVPRGAYARNVVLTAQLNSAKFVSLDYICACARDPLHTSMLGGSLAWS